MKYQTLVRDSMSRNLKITVIVALMGAVVLLPIANAQGPGWTANGTIVKLVNTTNGGINIRLSPDVTGCTSQSGYGPNYVSIYPDHPGINRIKADLLYAFATGTPISIYLADPTCKGTELVLGGW